jgi:hypothetical protein
MMPVTERRESRRPAGELIRTADYEAARIENAAAARAFVERAAALGGDRDQHESPHWVTVPRTLALGSAL